MEIEAHIIFKNSRMMQFMREHKLTLKKLAKEIGIPAVTLGTYINFRQVPRPTTKNKIHKYLKKFNSELKISDIFPDNYKKAVELFGYKKIIGRDIDLDHLLTSEKERLALEAPDKYTERNELKGLIKNILDTIEDKRHRKIITMIYGLDGKGRFTIYEISKEVCLSPAQIGILHYKILEKHFKRAMKKYFAYSPVNFHDDNFKFIFEGK